MPEIASQRNPERPPAGQGPMGQYYLLEKIAQGGMAEIYKGLAYDLHGIKRTVVIKKILPHAAANKEFIDMLVAEAKIAVMLSHGNIAQIYDLGKAGDDYFIVMEYVDGRSLSQIMKQAAAVGQSIPVPIVCAVAAEVAAGLDYMHRRTDEHGQPLHIIHRDVSPQNIIISTAGTVKIIDFGIAKARTKLETTDIGILKGKFAYMSPEQAEGNPIDHRSDLFSLGVIAYEMLTGQRLFKAKDNRETLRNVRRAVVSPPSSLRPDLPQEMDVIMGHALAKTCAARYPYPSEMRNDLLRFLHRSYPDFRPTAVAEYVASLFHTEPSAGPLEEEAKTPLLIIDHTQSAIAPEVADLPLEAPPAPGVVAEYLLSMPEDVDEVAKPQAGEEISEVSLTPMMPSKRRTLGSRRTRLLAALLTGIIIAPIAWIVWQRAGPGTNGPERQPAQIATPSTQTPAAPAPSLTIVSTPPGAQVFLDDQATPYRTPAVIDGLITGRQYAVGLFLDHYKFWSTRLTAQGGKTERLDVPLEIDYSALEVLSEPAGARVVLDGAAIGTTPLTRSNLMPDAVLAIEVTAEGYRPWHQAVRAAPGKTTTVRAILQRERSR
ncbi:MAG: serine/threonine protein kinase [Deltaproteobacteria bacterium]|nr:serine/threonine protein kinase [Deltaproteobacteria bacterium]